MATRFLRIFSLFILPIVLFFTVAELLLSQVDNSNSLKRKLLERELSNVQTIVLGTSHTYYGIDPQYFNASTVNLANTSQTLYYDYSIIHKYLDSLTKLKTVIIPFDYFTLYYNGDREEWRRLFYLRFWGIDNPTISPIDIRKYSLFALYQPTLAVGILKNMIKERKIRTNILVSEDDISATGFSSHSYTPKDTSGFEQTAIERFKVWNDMFINESNYEQNAKLLNTFAKELKAKNIKFLFISSPITTNMYAKQEKRLLDKNASFILQLKAQFDNIDFLDFSNDSRFVFSDFEDADHLNFHGAKKLSLILNDYIAHSTSKN